MLKSKKDMVSAVSSNLVSTLGEKLRKGENAENEVDTAGAVGQSQFVGVYFGAHWAPPCRKFTHSLKKNYEEANKDGQKLEIVFCSQDGNHAAFKRNFNDMEWYAVDFEDKSRIQSLQQTFGVMELPTLIIIDKDGQIVSQSGDTDLKGGTAKAMEKWESEQAKLAAQ